MLIDLHCHTAPRSECSALRPEEYIDLARERGLDGVCLTEHDTFWPADELSTLAARTGFVVLAGAELTTDAGHVLAFGLPESRGPLHLLAAVHRLASRARALLYLAHPARDGLLRVDRQTVESFASVEAINGSDSRLQNMAATGLASGFSHPGIGGSDAHSAEEVGRAATEFDARITDEASLVEALRSGTYRAVAL